MHGFMDDTGIVGITTDVVVTEGIFKQQKRHEITLDNERDRKERAAIAKVEAEKANEKRKQDRRVARAKRAKD